MTKYIATRRKPEGPKARQVRVPSKNAAAMPDTESPDTRIGEPAKNINMLLRIEEFHVGGEDWMSSITNEMVDRKPMSGEGRELAAWLIL